LTFKTMGGLFMDGISSLDMNLHPLVD